MRVESCREWRGALAAWVLGGLDGAEAGEVVAHMGDCEGCRAEAADLSEVAAALATADPLHAEAPPQPPPGLADGISARIGEQREAASGGRRWWLTAAAAGVIAVAVVVITAVWWPTAEQPPRAAVALTEVAEGLEASVDLEERGWGASLNITASGLDGGDVYRVWVEDRSGQRHSAGTFRGLGDGEVTCYMTAATSLGDAAVVGIDGPDGAPVLRGDVRADEAAARAGP